MHDHPRRVAREDNSPWIQPLEIPTGQGQVGEGRNTKEKEKGQPESEGVFQGESGQQCRLQVR